LLPPSFLVQQHLHEAGPLQFVDAFFISFYTFKIDFDKPNNMALVSFHGRCSLFDCIISVTQKKETTNKTQKTIKRNFRRIFKPYL